MLSLVKMKPLGEYEQLLGPDPREWSAGSVSHGSRVLDHLVAGIEHHRETATDGYWARLGAQPAALGCVPWLTDWKVSRALASLAQCCILLDKQQPPYPAVEQLAKTDSALSSAYLRHFDMLALPNPDGSGPVLGPFSQMPPPVLLGPVRLVGWARDQHGKPRPMLHSKMLVLGVTTYWENDEDWSGDVAQFEPKVTWMGSANWTSNARQHIEHGLWSTDPALVAHNYEYLLDLVRFSEPFGASTVGPEPELVSAVFDDDAMREYLAEHPPEPDPDDPEW